MTKKSDDWVRIMEEAADWRGRHDAMSARTWYQVLVDYGHYLLSARRSMPEKLRFVTLGKTVSALHWAEKAGAFTRYPMGRYQDVDMYEWTRVEQAIEELLDDDTSESRDDDEDGGVAPSLWS